MLTKKMFVTGLVAASLAAIAPAWAAPFLAGDVFASVGNGQVQHYSAAGALLETLNTGVGGFTTGSGFDAQGNLYVTNFSSSGNTGVTRFTGPNDPHNPSSFGSGYSSGTESIVFDRAGNAYVGAADGDRDIRKLDSAGNPLAQFNVATERRGSDWIDLAADQKTMFYTSEGRIIFRYDVANNAQLSNFTTLPGSGTAFAFRLLQGGGLLVADSGNIKRLDASGNVVSTYDATGQDNWFSLNLNPDNTSFWSGDFGTGTLMEFDIATGDITQTINTGSRSLFGVSVFGEATQGGGCRVDCNGVVPEPGTLALAAIGFLGLFGLPRRRRQD